MFSGIQNFRFLRVPRFGGDSSTCPIAFDSASASDDDVCVVDYRASEAGDEAPPLTSLSEEELAIISEVLQRLRLEEDHLRQRSE